MCSDTSQSSESGLTETYHFPAGSNPFQDVLQRLKTLASRMQQQSRGAKT